MTTITLERTSSLSVCWYLIARDLQQQKRTKEANSVLGHWFTYSCFRHRVRDVVELRLDTLAHNAMEEPG